MLDLLPEWAVAELRELRRAPFAASVLFFLGLAVGFTVGRWFYSERIEVLNDRIEALQEQDPPTDADSPTEVMLRWGGGEGGRAEIRPRRQALRPPNTPRPSTFSPTIRVIAHLPTQRCPSAGKRPFELLFAENNVIAPLAGDIDRRP